MRDDDQFLIVGLNSCDEAPLTLINSAIGRLGSGQIARFEAIVRDAGERCVIVLIHHHLGIPQEILTMMEQNLSPLEIESLALRDAGHVASILSRLKKCFVFHGHKHIAYHAKIGTATIVAGSSVTFGDLRGFNNGAIYSIDRSGAIATLHQSPIATLPPGASH